MMLALTVVSTSLLLWQASEDVAAPQINSEPNYNALTTVLSVPSAKVNGPVRADDKGIGHVYQVGGSVSPPRVTYSKQPDSEQNTGKAEHTGTVLIRGVVGTDGKIHNARVVRRLGMGLDEKALEAVNQWLFEPATKDGQKVAVQVEIEIKFKLYQ